MHARSLGLMASLPEYKVRQNKAWHFPDLMRVPCRHHALACWGCRCFLSFLLSTFLSFLLSAQVQQVPSAAPRRGLDAVQRRDTQKRKALPHDDRRRLAQQQPRVLLGCPHHLALGIELVENTCVAPEDRSGGLGRPVNSPGGRQFATRLLLLHSDPDIRPLPSLLTRQVVQVLGHPVGRQV